MSLVFSGLLVRALARRADLRMDYRAAGAAAYLGLGATWALGLSSSAAQLQANAASLPKPLLEITGVIPFAADDLPVAIDGDRGGADRGLDGDCAVVGAVRAADGHGADDGRSAWRRRFCRLRRPSGPASGSNTAR